jgi:hypothetical protein
MSAVAAAGLGTFLPVLVLRGALAARASTPVSALLCALLALWCVGVAWVARRRRVPAPFAAATAAYFGLVGAGLVLWPEAGRAIAGRWAETLLFTLLACRAALPPLLGGTPFTEQFARLRVPEAFWQSVLFRGINRRMTFAWAGIFACCGLLGLLPWPWARAVLPPAVVLGVGVPFTRRYPARAMGRAAVPGPQGPPPALREGSGDRGREASGAGDRGAVPAAPVVEAAGSGTMVEHHGWAPRKEGAMRVIAIESSPRADGQSKTRMLLEAVVAGLREEGAEVRVVPLRQAKVNPCIGCYTCWTKTPGRCIHRDQMSEELFPAWLAADLAIYASPLYHYGVTATMKAFIERTLPALEPFFEERAGRTVHPSRVRLPGAVVLSVAGFPERGVFSELSSWARRVFGEHLRAEIYRPEAEVLGSAGAGARAAVLGAAQEAGRELARGGSVAQGTLERIGAPLGDLAAFRTVGNLMWRTCIAEKITPREMQERGMVPRPDSIESYLQVLALGFNAAGAGGTRAVIQFDFTGERPGSCHLRIEDGRLESGVGPAERPDVTVEAPFEAWMDVMTRKANPQLAFMTGKFRARGDVGLLLRMPEFFGPS